MTHGDGGGRRDGQCNPKGNRCTPGCFLPGLSNSWTRAWVAELVEARAVDVDFVSVLYDAINR